MARKPSRREQDQKRRASRSGVAGQGGRIVLALFAAAIVVAFILSWRGPADEASTGQEHRLAFGLDDDPFLGMPEAPVTLVGYESPHCSSCKSFHLDILPRLKQRHLETGEASYYYIQGTIGNDEHSSVAQECVHQHGGNVAFWELADRLYARADTYVAPPWEQWLDDVAQRHQLDEEALRACYDGRETLERVRQDLRTGQQHGALGTPTFWLFSESGPAERVERWTDVEQAVAGLVARA